MKAFICNSCNAEIPGEKPDICPLCGQHSRGFEETERKEKEDKEDKKSSVLYEKALKELKKYDEGCEPENPKFCFEE
jgi:rubrerythrin